MEATAVKTKVLTDQSSIEAKRRSWQGEFLTVTAADVGAVAKAAALLLVQSGAGYLAGQAEYFLQILDYAMQARGKDPLPVLKELARSLQFRLEQGTW